MEHSSDDKNLIGDNSNLVNGTMANENIDFGSLFGDGDELLLQNQGNSFADLDAEIEEMLQVLQAPSGPAIQQATASTTVINDTTMRPSSLRNQWTPPTSPLVAHAPGADTVMTDASSTPIIAIPSLAEIAHICDLYNRYRDSYSSPNYTPEASLELGKSLGCALLQHYYPTSQDFVIREERFAKFAKYGFSVEKKHRKKHQQTQDSYMIEREHIAGFAVEKKYWVPNLVTKIEEEHRRVHTVMAIMIDDASQWDDVEHNPTVSRGDFLAFSLNYDYNIAQGQGIMLYGRLLEFYEIDNRVDDEKEKEKAQKKGTQKKAVMGFGQGPEVKGKHRKPHSWFISEANLGGLDQVFRRVAATNMTYDDGGVGEGVKGL